MATGDDLTVSERDGVTIVRFNNQSLFGPDIEDLNDRIRALVDGGVRRLVLDFTHVRYAGSAALGMALSLSRTLQHAGGRMALSSTGGIDALLKVTRAASLFTIAPNSEAAIAMLQ